MQNKGEVMHLNTDTEVIVNKILETWIIHNTWNYVMKGFKARESWMFVRM
jgi:hypothetical protein